MVIDQNYLLIRNFLWIYLIVSYSLRVQAKDNLNIHVFLNRLRRFIRIHDRDENFEFQSRQYAVIKL